MSAISSAARACRSGEAKRDTASDAGTHWKSSASSPTSPTRARITDFGSWNCCQSRSVLNSRTSRVSSAISRSSVTPPAWHGGGPDATKPRGCTPGLRRQQTSGGVEDVHHEDERGVRGDRALVLRPVALVRRDDHEQLAADGLADEALVPAGDDAGLSDVLDGERVTPVPRRVELCAVPEPAGVLDGHGLAGGHLRAG